MSFMQSYKRLDVLCRDMNGIGISGYIADMEQLTNGRLFVAGWEEDYRLLKHYRHIRNRIAHDVDATEDALCTAEDAAWIEEFYGHILNQTDPLAVYCKASLQQKSVRRTAESFSSGISCAPPSLPRPNRKLNANLPLIVTLLAGGAAVFILLILLFLQ